MTGRLSTGTPSLPQAVEPSGVAYVPDNRRHDGLIVSSEVVHRASNKAMYLVGLTTAVLVAGLLYMTSALDYWRSAGIVGADYRVLIAAAERWLSGTGFYWPYQLAGPYTMNDLAGPHSGVYSPNAYPPTMLLLFAPFTVLPAILWWIAPIAVTAWVVWKHQPRPLVWPVLAFLIVFPTSQWTIVTGNPTLWFTMALALGTVYSWPAVLVLLKPTLAPLALIGVRRRSWWLALLGLGAVSLVFLPLWADYLTVLRNTDSSIGPLYSLNQLPILFIPIFAWLGSDREREG